MSNCINIHNPEVVFAAKEFDVAAYKERCDRLSPFHPTQLPGRTEQEEQDRYFCWFLTRNSNFSVDSVAIYFGDGHSSHTHRDFRYTVDYLLAPYFRRFKTHTFVLSDEFDGFKTSFKQTVVFKPRRRTA